MSSSQKFISRNRAPRVQIEYDVELYGAEKKVQLPFVMGVMSDLSGKAEKPPVGDRAFLEIDVDNFNDRMKAMAPKAQFSVPNTLTGDGNLAIDLTFEKLSDFSPAAVAEKVDTLRPLLEARRQLSDLITYMDGKAGAEALIETLLQQPALLSALSGQSDGSAEVTAALDSLRAAAPPEEDATDDVGDTLAALRKAAPADAPEDTSVSDALTTLTPPPEEETRDEAADVLAAMERREIVEEDNQTDAILATVEQVEDTLEVDTTADVLAAIEAVEMPEETDTTSEILASVDAREPDAEQDQTDEVLAGIEAIETVEEVDTTADVLASIDHVEEAEQADETADVLSGIEAVHEDVEDDRTEDILASIEAVEVAEDTGDTADILASIEAVEVAPVADETADVLASIEAVDAPQDVDETDDVLASLEQVKTVEAEDDIADVLAGLEAVEPSEEVDDTADILAALEPTDVADAGDETRDVLAGVAPVEVAAEADTTADVLASLEAVDTPVEAGETADDILSRIDTTGPEPDEVDTADDVLASLEAVETVEDADRTEDVLAGLDTSVAQDASPDDDLDDILAGLETSETPPEAGTNAADDILAAMETAESDVTDAGDELDALLSGLSADAPDTASNNAPGDDLEALLADLSDAAPEEPAPDQTVDILASVDRTDTADSADAGGDDLDALLAGIEAQEPTADDADTDDLDDLLADLASEETEAPADQGAASDDLDALLADLTPEAESEPTPEPGLSAGDDDLDALLAAAEPEIAGEDAAEEDDLDALLADLGPAADTPEEVVAPEDDLDALLAGLEADAEDPEPSTPADEEDDLDALLAGLSADAEDEAPPVPDPSPEDDLDALLADLEADTVSEPAASDDLDALLADIPTQEAAVAPSAPAQNPFGTISAARPAREDLNRGRFRMALFGDFTGRAAKGLMETGDALAARKPIELDVDTVEDVIEGFATTLSLPIGKDGAGIEVPLKELDDLHPDELFDNVELFDALSGLKQQLGVGAMADKARERLKGWSQTYGTPIRLPKRSAATSVPPDLKLSDFQALIGDTSGRLTQASPIDEMLARIVGPHIVKSPDADAKAMQGAVDEALSSAMRLILHHPDFQAVESQWRSLDLLARRIETDAKLQIVLYDVSAEEMAADLAAQEDLGQSGFFRLLTDVLDPETGDGGFSALFGLYTFEETPPHAELLARIGSVAAHVDAPFFAAMTPGYLETAKEDRHPLVAKAWDQLRALPEAAYLGLASPRFLLRQPYGSKSDPIYPFEFEEFTPQEGLSGMLWANPVVLVAILLAGTYKKDGQAMNLGSLMSLGEMPFHYMKDRYGDQVALPCTERNLTTDPAQATLGRGYMPVLWMKGRNEIRLGAFRSVGGEEIAGPWSGTAPPPRRTAPVGQPDLEVELTSTDEVPEADQSLDDLLASFEDNDADDVDLEDMDPELAALLEGL